MISYTKRRLRVIISFLFVLSYCIIVLCPVQAADIERIKIDENAPHKVVLIVGKSTLIETPMNIKRVALASPEYADVQIVSPRQLYLIGNSAGLTTLTLWGIDGKVSHMLDIEVVLDVTCLKEKIYEMFPNEKNIKVTSSHDALVLTGTVSNTSNLTQVLALAQAYVRDKDGKSKVMNMLEVGGVQQVMLEVRVAEMQRTLMKRLGVNFNYISDGGNTFGITALNSLASVPATLPPSPSIASGNVSAIFRFLGGGATWTVFIDALQENGLTKLLAEPTLITTSGRTANFLAGGEFPIPVPQSGVGAGSTITIDYKTYGVGLNFTPTVLSNEKISMVVSPEVSELDYTNALSISGYVVPALTTRRASTVIELADGQSFAIAGLLQSQVIEDVKKYPVLGEIPILGALFRSSSFQKSESELVIIVTPHLVKPLDMAKQTLPTDQYVEPNDFEFYLLGSTEGLGEPSQSSRSAVPPKSDKTGFEGDFGHIVPK